MSRAVRFSDSKAPADHEDVSRLSLDTHKRAGAQPIATKASRVGYASVPITLSSAVSVDFSTSNIFRHFVSQGEIDSKTLSMGIDAVEVMLGGTGLVVYQCILLSAIP
jgi:hypothetical protein